MSIYKKNSISKDEIREDVLNLLNARFGIAQNRFSDIEENDFFGIDGLLTIRSLVYLVHFLEEKYSILFTEVDYNNPNFYTLEGLSCILEKRVNA